MSVAAVAAAACLGAGASAASAATTITVSSTADSLGADSLGAGSARACTLRDALVVADKKSNPALKTGAEPGGDGAKQDCSGRVVGTGSPYTVVLSAGAVYTLEQVDNYWFGPDGLPPISAKVTLEGNGATVTRPTGQVVPNFRFFYVSGGLSGIPAGRLTLQDLTLSNGRAQGGGSDLSGGGAGMGGAIFNQGTVALQRVTLSGNIAQGGFANGGLVKTPTAGEGGGGIGQSALASGQGGGFGGPAPGEHGGAGGPGNAQNGTGGDGGGFLPGNRDLGGFGSDGADNGADGGSGGDVGDDDGAAGGAFGKGGGVPVIHGGGDYAGGGGGGGVGGGGGYGFGGAGGGFGGGGVAPQDASGGGGGNGGFGGGGGGSGAGASPGGFGGGSDANGGGGGGMGGAVFSLFGKVTISNSTLAGNDAIGGLGGGAGASADTPAGGSGDGLGGAVFNVDGALSVSGSTVAGNSAAGGSQGGGGVYSLAFGNTIRRGSATTASVSISGSILYGNTGAGAAGNDLVLDRVKGLHHHNRSVSKLLGADIIGQTATAGGASASGSPITADPKLGPLQSSVGSPATLQPGAGSPALAAGGPCDVTDELGTPRPTVGCDLGALEQTPAFVTTANAGDQKISLIAPAPSRCTARTKPLAVALESVTVDGSSAAKLKFERAVVEIGKGARHRATLRHQPASLELSITGLSAGPHRLTVTVAYAKATRRGGHSASAQITRTLATQFTVC
jgi:hypothetical protein